MDRKMLIATCVFVVFALSCLSWFVTGYNYEADRD